MPRSFLIKKKAERDADRRYRDELLRSCYTADRPDVDDSTPPTDRRWNVDEQIGHRQASSLRPPLQPTVAATTVVCKPRPSAPGSIWSPRPVEPPPPTSPADVKPLPPLPPPPPSRPQPQPSRPEVSSRPAEPLVSAVLAPFTPLVQPLALRLQTNGKLLFLISLSDN